MRHLYDKVKTVDQGLIFDEKIYRQLKLLASVGPSALPADQLDRVGCFFFNKTSSNHDKKLSD